MEHQFFFRQQNLKLYRSLVAASEGAAAKPDARQEKLLKLLAEEVANEPPPRLRDIDLLEAALLPASSSRDPLI
jgi:hypothetical protein